MVDRYAKFATEHLAVAAARIESGLLVQNVGNVLRFPYGGERSLGYTTANPLKVGGQGQN